MERPGDALPEDGVGRPRRAGQPVDRPAGESAPGGVEHVSGSDEEAEAVEFVRFCYRRRAVAWPELYDEMCAVAARGEYRGMSYEQLEDVGIRLALASLPRLASMVQRVVAEERGSGPRTAPAGA